MRPGHLRVGVWVGVGGDNSMGFGLKPVSFWAFPSSDASLKCMMRGSRDVYRVGVFLPISGTVSIAATQKQLPHGNNETKGKLAGSI